MRVQTLLLVFISAILIGCSGSEPDSGSQLTEPRSRELVDIPDPDIPRAVGAIDESGLLIHPEHVLLTDIDDEWIELERTILTATGSAPPPIGCVELDGFGSILGAQPEAHVVWETEAAERLTQTVYLTDSVEEAESIAAIYSARMFAECDRLDEIGLVQSSAVDVDLGLGFPIVEVADVDGFVGHGIVTSRSNVVSFLSLESDGTTEFDEAAFIGIAAAMLEALHAASPVPADSVLVAPAG